ncbi:MAG: PD40 domain-containing protein [Bacteroidales bacterium]|nr:PD40 domain-containing protein [Bacteroidales bacterium]
MKSKRKWCLRFMLVAMLTAISSLSQAQFYNGMNMEFGKNRVQWKSFHWSYYKYETFDVYFYQGGNELANYVLNYAKDEIPEMEKRFGNHFGKKVQFLVFNSLGDLKQSNLNNDEEDTGNTGGVTKIIGSKVFLYFNGNYADFEQQIKEGIAHLLLTQVMNGTSIGSQVRSSYRYDIPEWFQNGLCAYITEDWDSFKEDRLQQGILSGEFKKINQLRDQDAIIAGYSFWGFIEEKYGTKAFNEILTLAESSQNVKKAMLYVTGVKYKELIKQWYGFYEERYKVLRQSKPSEVMALKYRKHRTYTQPEVSPDGKRIAYVSNDEGRINIWIEELATGKKERLYKGGYRSDTWIDTSFPLLAWHPTGSILSFIIEEKGQLLLCNLDIGTKKIGQTNLYEFQKITSFSYAHKDRKIVLSASRFGKPDIFVYNLFSNTLEQITDDYYTDLSPVFSADDKQIIFSSNRIGETLEVLTSPGIQRKQFNLYAYDYANKSQELRNLTGQQLSSSILPKSFTGNKLFYLNDSSGFYNLYEARFDSAVNYIDTAVHYRYYTVSKPLTNYTSSIIDYSYNPREKKLVMLLPDQNGQKFYTTYYQAGSTGAGISQMNPYAQQRLMKKKQAEEAVIEKTTSHRFKNSYRAARKKKPSGITADSTVQYVSPIPISSYEGLLVAKKDTTVRAQNYYVELFTDKLTSQLDFSYMNYSYQPFSSYGGAIYLSSPGNVLLGSTMADLMEDYKIDLGVKLNRSLINNEYVVRFRDLSRRLDKSLTLHRYVTDNYGTYYYRTFTNEAFYTLSYPFNEILSLRGTALYRWDNTVSLAIDDHSLAEGNFTDHLGGLRAELVYDNSKKLQTNLYVGARGKVFAEYYQTINKNTKNLFVVGFDYRNYTRIHRNFIWANRIAGSSSFGQNKLIYYMGGVDNWILAQFDYETPIDYTQNYRYQTLATNMRGFKQNIRNGNNFMVLNSELRFPVFSYLLDRPINMQFIKNFQVVAFGDIGTAWTGWNPYDPSNSLYTSYYHDGNLDISVTRMKEPIVGGVGLGLRTTLLGYFVRGDMAWGIEDGKIIKKPQFYLSFNLDF